MTRIDFYTGVDSQARTIAQLCLKALTQDMPVVVLTTSPADAEQIDTALWAHPATGFIPHVRAPHRLAAVTPVVIGHSLADLEGDGLLINLQREVPELFSRFRRVAEIVSTDDDATQAGRTRYRFYRGRGYELGWHDLREKRA
jgi:DNA polymerase-3 subunit chi